MDAQWWSKMVERVTHKKFELQYQLRDKVINSHMKVEVKSKLRTTRAHHFY